MKGLSITDSAESLDDSYINAMTKPKNHLNKLLHSKWEPWARRSKYQGEHDVHVLLDRRENPLYDRFVCVQKYGFAIPNEVALKKLADYGPIIEIGSGKGYWAYLLKARGVDIITVDDRPHGSDDWCQDTIQQDGAEYLDEHDGCPDRTLFLCWPDVDDSVIRAYDGKYAIIISEMSTWELAESDEQVYWQLKETVEIPLWPGMHDKMHIYYRIH